MAVKVVRGDERQEKFLIEPPLYVCLLSHVVENQV